MKIPQFSSLLLSALLALGGITLTIIHEDANRLVSTVQTIAQKQADDHTDIQTNKAEIRGLKNVDELQWAEISNIRTGR